MTKSNINIGKFKAAEFKQAGFKSKTIARKLTKLLNTNTKRHENVVI